MIDCNSPIAIKNDTHGLRKRIHTIGKIILENHSKWEAAQLRGEKFCSLIDTIKRHAIDEYNQDHSMTLYPDDLKTPCDKLKIITTIFEDILKSTTEAHRQIIAIEKLQSNGVNKEIKLLRSWGVEPFKKSISILMRAYEQELELKLNVMKNIAHSKNVNDLVLHGCVWEFPCYVNDSLETVLLSLKQECEIDGVSNK